MKRGQWNIHGDSASSSTSNRRSVFGMGSKMVQTPTVPSATYHPDERINAYDMSTTAMYDINTNPNEAPGRFISPDANRDFETDIPTSNRRVVECEDYFDESLNQMVISQPYDPKAVCLTTDKLCAGECYRFTGIHSVRPVPISDRLTGFTVL